MDKQKLIDYLNNKKDEYQAQNMKFLQEKWNPSLKESVYEKIAENKGKVKFIYGLLKDLEREI